MEVEITGLGTVKGIDKGRVSIFRGVPFAEPAVGKRRWLPALAKKPWGGLLDCTEDRSNAPQTVSRVFAALGDAGGQPTKIGEDCFNLTIWAPANAEKAPVLFWIHGGGFMSGGGSWPWYDGERIARDYGLVVVGCNYRVGAFGYLSVPGKVEENLGLRDQMVALDWVRQHIADFGGDPDNVTAAGQSAGAHSIISHFGHAETKGLFHRAILQSPPAGVSPRSAEEAARFTTVFLDLLGLSADQDDLLDRMGEIPLPKVLEAQGKTAAATLPSVGHLEPPFEPWTSKGRPEGETFLGPLAREAAARGVEILLGWTKDEAALFTFKNPAADAMTEEGLRDYAATQFGEAADQVLAEARARRPDADTRILFDELVSQRYFRGGCVEFADGVVGAGGTLFVYHFEWNAGDGLRACHCGELPFTFGNLDAWPGSALMAGADGATLEPMTRDVMSRFNEFVRTGNPGFAAWTPADKEILVIDTEVTVRPVTDVALL